MKKLFIKLLDVIRDYNDDNKKVYLELDRKIYDHYSSRVLSLLGKDIDLPSINSIYLISEYMANEDNLNDSLQFLKAKRYGKFNQLSSTVPDNFTEEDAILYVVYEMYYITSRQCNYLAIILDKVKDGEDRYTVVYLMEDNVVDIDLIKGKKLIYDAAI